MAISPWALIRNAETPLETTSPTPWAPVPEDQAQQSGTSSRNLVSHLGGEGQGKALPVEPALAPEIQNTQDQLQKVRYAQTHPWGTVENHPGKIGKIAHIFSEIGNIAGNIVAPNAMANVPGSQLNMQGKEASLTNRLEKEQEQSATEQQQAATAGHLNAETPEVAPNAESTRKLQGEQGENLASEIKMREHPLPEYEQVPGMLTPTGQPVEMEKYSGAYAPGNVSGLHYGKAVDKFQHVNGTVNGVPTSAFADPLNHLYVDQDGNQIPNFKPQPQPAMMPPWMYNPQGNDVFRPVPGKALPAGVVTPTQLGQGNTRMEALKIYQPTTDSAERFNVMADNYEDAIKNHDQQAMLSLLYNHMGMTMGLQKGARMTQDLIREAQHSQPWLQGMAAKFDSQGYLTGVTLSPQQMREMVNNARGRYSEDVKRSRAQGKYMGMTDDGPPRDPSDSVQRYYLYNNGKDPNKAREAMKADGWTF